MRLFLGMLLGAALTIAFAYMHDARVPTQTTQTEGGGEIRARTLVNWDIAGGLWNGFTDDVARMGRQAKDGVERMAGRQ